MNYQPNIVGAYVGYAGGGKSLSLTGLIIKQLLAGRRVWSNMPVQISPALLNRGNPFGHISFPRTTEPLNMQLLYMLDDSLVEGTIALDEMGYYADSRLSGSIKNRLITSITRQLRHRQLHFFYTAFDFMRVDSRLRDETDFVCQCEDLAGSPWGEENENVVGGLVILQRYFDLTGKMTKGRNVVSWYSGPRTPYSVLNFHARPFWECYDTRKIVSLEEAFSGVELDLQKTRISNRSSSEDAFMETDVAIAKKVAEIADEAASGLAPSRFAEIVCELGLPNNKTTRNKFRSRGLAFDTTMQGYRLVGRERVGGSVAAL